MLKKIFAATVALAIVWAVAPATDAVAAKKCSTLVVSLTAPGWSTLWPDCDVKGDVGGVSADGTELVVVGTGNGLDCEWYIHNENDKTSLLGFTMGACDLAGAKTPVVSYHTGVRPKDFTCVKGSSTWGKEKEASCTISSFLED